MENSITELAIPDFVHLQEQANQPHKDKERLSLWIACTDPQMDTVLSRIDRELSGLILRRRHFEVPSSNLDMETELSSINFAVERLMVRDIIVCGHSLCSFVPSSRPIERSEARLDGLDAICKGVVSRHARNEQARAHLIEQLNRLKEYPSVNNALASGALRLHGLFYLVESGTWTRYDWSSRQFIACDSRDCGD